jgi:hypothetical protein
LQAEAEQVRRQLDLDRVLGAAGKPVLVGSSGLRDHAIRSGEVQYPAWGSLLYAVETGQSAFEHAHGTDFSGYLAAHPALNNSFNASCN